MKSALVLSVVSVLVASAGCDSSYTVPPRGDAGANLGSDGARDGGNPAADRDGDIIDRPADAMVFQDASPGSDARAVDASLPADARVADASDGPRQNLRYVINEFTLPTSSSSYAFDHDGDGTTENQYGGLVALLSQTGVSMQAVMDGSLAAGEDLPLIAFDTSDPALLADTTPNLRQHVAVTSSGPDFTGSGSFAVNTAKGHAAYQGVLSGGWYVSTLPRTMSAPPIIHLRLAIGNGATALLPVVGARIEARVTSTGLIAGRLHGAWRQSDFNAIVLPAMAAQLNAIINQVPCTGSCDFLKQSFDTNRDGTITATELQQNSLFSATFAPDLDLHDAAGNWSPTPNGSNPDAMSLSVAFHAVRAQFTTP